MPPTIRRRRPAQRFFAPGEPLPEPPDGRAVAPDGREPPPDGLTAPADERGLEACGGELPTVELRGAVVPAGLLRTDDGEPEEGAAPADGERTPEGLAPVMTGDLLSVDEPVDGTITGRELAPTRPAELRGATGCRTAPPRRMLGGAAAEPATLPAAVGRYRFGCCTVCTRVPAVEAKGDAAPVDSLGEMLCGATAAGSAGRRPRSSATVVR